MKTQRLLIALTVVNFAWMIFTLSRPRPVDAQSVAPVLRARALEIVDEHGQVRASLAVYPADPKVKMPDGATGYPETVLLRLITAKGRPNVKISANERGAATSFGGEADPTNVQILAEGATTSVKLVNKDGKLQIIKP